MFGKILNSLETHKHPLLGPNLWILKFAGLLQPKTGLKKLFYNLIHFAATLFVASQYMELYIIRSDLDSALRNLSISMLSTICVIKAGTYVFWNSKWKKILIWISMVELRLKKKQNDATTEMIMAEYKRYSRKITYFYWTLVYLTVIIVIAAPLATYISDANYREKIHNHVESYPEIMSSWLPFDKSRSFGYVLYIVEHMFMCYYGGGIIASYDTNAVVIMNFFAGQLKLLSIDCARIFENNKTASDKQALINIRDCHLRHTELLKYTKLFDSLLSPVMFVYMIVCSIMICASAIQLTKEGTSKMQQIWIAEYLISLITQLFLFCWHSNEVFFMSKEVDRGVYDSKWWKQDVRLRRSILLLAGKFGRTVIFTAGPFTDLTIATFVTILKGSYSYYAILSKNAD